MAEPISYLPQVAWEAEISNVVMLSATTYKVTAVAVDPNEPGSGVADVGYVLTDFIGHKYSITAVDGNELTLNDDFLTGFGAQSDRPAIICKTVEDGFIAPIRHERLDDSAIGYSRPIELDLMWKKNLHLDQTTPQSITGGIPLMESVVDANGSVYQLINKDYADKISSGVNITEYFTATASNIGGIYNVMQVNDTAFSTLTSATLTNGNDQNYRSFATVVGQPGLLRLLKGTYSIHVHLYKTGTKPVTVYYKLFQRKTDNSETLLATFETTSALEAISASYDLHSVISTTIQLSSDGSDRLVIKAYANVGITGSDVTIKTDIGEGFNSNFSFAIPVIELATIFEEKTNKVTSISSGSTDVQYPSAKLMYDQLVDVVRASTDTYTSVDKALYLITLTQAEYDAIGTKDVNTLYIIP